MKSVQWLGLPKLAHECASMAELDEAIAEWSARCNRLQSATRYSNSCISDSEYLSEATRYLMNCKYLKACILNGSKTF